MSNRANSDSSAAQPPGISGINPAPTHQDAHPDQCTGSGCPRCCSPKRTAIPALDQGQETFAQLDQWPGPRVTPIPRAIARIDHQSAGHLCLTVSAGMAITMENRVVGNPITSAATTYSSTTFPSATFPASLEARSFPTGNAFHSQVTLNPFFAVDSGERKHSTIPTPIWTVTNGQHFTAFSAAFPITSGIISFEYVKKLPILQSPSPN